MSPVSRVPPPRDDPRPRKPRSRPSAMSRSFERRMHRCYFSGGSSTTVARVSRGAGSTRARRARAGSPENPPDSRDRAPRVVRGGRYAARGVVTHATIIIQRFGGRSFSRHLFSIGRGRARRATRLRPPKRGSRVAAGSRAPVARSRARPPHRHPVADRSHPRAPLPRPRCQLSRPRGSSGVSRRIAIRNPSRAREACLGIFPTH